MLDVLVGLSTVECAHKSCKYMRTDVSIEIVSTAPALMSADLSTDTGP